MTLNNALTTAKEAGFSYFCPINAKMLRFLPEVRAMCSSNLCRNYGKSWSCPPFCGTLEEVAEIAGQYNQGILVQSTATLEDSFDFEGMMALEELHKRRFFFLVEQIRVNAPNCLPMAAGSCTVCPSCTCPDAPCRFPAKMIPSMESYGLNVSEVCINSGIPYYHGPNTLTYTSCILLD